MAVTKYATKTDMEQIISTFGIDTRLDDDQDGSPDAGLSDAVLEQASLEVNKWLFQRGYSVATLQASTWAKWGTAYFAVGRACIRRGNNIPAGLQDQIEEYLAELKAISRGDMELIADTGLAAPTGNHIPSVTNFGVDSRSGRGKVKVVESTSTGDRPDGFIKHDELVEQPDPLFL